MHGVRSLLACLLLVAPASGESLQLLDFTATWCGPCRATKPEVAKLKQQGYPIREVDVDENPELASRYRVEAIPTFIVVDGDGTELGRISGAQTAEELARLYDSAASAREAKAAKKASREDEEIAPGSADWAKPWETVVRIKVLNHLSRPRASVGFGSGTIIYSTEEESIILTCAHIFHVDELRKPVAPSKFPLKVRVDLFDGRLSGGKTPQVHTTEVDIPAEVLDYDFVGDVGLIRIRPGRKLPSSPVADPGWKPKANMQLTTVGCSQGQDATAWTTHVTRPFLQLQTPNGLYSATECSHPPLQGRSGGGLFTLDGRLVGVCDFNDGPRGKHGLYAAPATIHTFINRNRMQVCYAGNRDTGDRRAIARGNDRGRGRDRDGDDVTIRMTNDGLEGRADRMPIPPPDLMRVSLPGERVAANDGGDYRWRPKMEANPSLERVQLSGRVESAEPIERSTGRHRTAGLEMGPAADGDLFAAAPDPEPSPVRARVMPEQPRIVPSDTVDAWQSTAAPSR